MIYRIVQYIQPWEIDDLDRQIDQHIKSFYYIDFNEDVVIFDITMNTRVVDWENSKLPETYFLNKLKYLETKLKQYFNTEFDLDENINGCTDKRRSAHSKKQDFIVWLDSDIYFPQLTLPYLINSSKQIDDKYFILSPQIIKYWDDSWNCITNSMFLKEAHNHRDYADLYQFDHLVNNQKEISIYKNETIKMGGGWFNMIKSNVFDIIPVPKELGSYGHEDTYLAICAKQIANQYVLNGIVLSEIGARLLENKDYIKPLLSIKNKQYEKLSDEDFSNLIIKFYTTK